MTAVTEDGMARIETAEKHVNVLREPAPGRMTMQRLIEIEVVAAAWIDSGALFS